MSCVHSTPRPVTSVPLTAPTCLANRLSALRNGQRPGHRNVEVAGPRHHDLSNASTNAPRRLLLLLHGGRPAVKLQRARVTTSSTPTTPTDSGKASVSCSTAYSSSVAGVRPPLWIGEAMRRVDRAREESIQHATSVEGWVDRAMGSGVGGSGGGWGWTMRGHWIFSVQAERCSLRPNDQTTNEHERRRRNERTKEGRKEGRKEERSLCCLSFVGGGWCWCVRQWWWWWWWCGSAVCVCGPLTV